MTATSIDTKFSDAESDINLILEKLKNEVKSMIAPTPAPTPTPGVLLQDGFDDSYTFDFGATSKNGEWLEKYVGSGKVAFENGVLRMVPKQATNYSNDSSGVGYETYACQVQSIKSFSNFQLDIDMKTNKMLRTGPSKYGMNLVNGVKTGPQPWECAWIFFRFTDEQPKSNHHYYFIIRPDKCEFGKKDNAPTNTANEQQIYLPKIAEKKLVIGTTNHVTIKAVDKHIIITVDGTKIVDFVDTWNDPAKMGQGKIAMYCEDADVSFDNVKVVAA